MSWKADYAAQVRLCVHSLRVATRNVCYRPMRHVSASSAAHAARRHFSSPNVFGWFDKLDCTAQVRPCIRSLCVATQNVYHRYIQAPMKTSCQVSVNRACCVVADRHPESLRVSWKADCAAQVRPCMRSLRVATRNVCHRPIRHVSASSTAHAAGRHLSSPNVFGWFGKQIALRRCAPASAVCAWRSKSSVTAPYRYL